MRGKGRGWRSTGEQEGEGQRMEEHRRTGGGLTCCNVAVSVFVIVEWVVTGSR